MRYDILHIASIINGILEGHCESNPEYLATDSRKIPFPSQTIFFAISGIGRDAHPYIKDAWLKGVRSFVVQKVPELSEYPHTAFIKVKNPLKALQDLAAYHRAQFHGNVVGITGSNGKTIVKEWLFILLHQDKIITRSPRSYNSQVGVPLSVWLLDERSEWGIFEAGISQTGEMQRLERIIKPHYGIFTNIGDAHDEGFSNKAEKIREKLQLFEHASELIYCSDYTELKNEILNFVGGKSIKLFSWGSHSDADLQLISVRDDIEGGSILQIRFGSIINYLKIPLKGKIALENAMTVIAFLLKRGYSFEVLAERMHLLHSISMRLEIKKGIHGSTIINDSYSADLNSLKLALDLMKQQTQPESRTLILSDFLQSGKRREELYSEIASLLKTYHVHRLIGIGTDIQSQRHLFVDQGITTETFPNTEDFIKNFNGNMFSNELILMKGARKFAFETILSKLEMRSHQTELSIDLSAIRHNLSEYRKILNPSTKIMVVVKAFSYGSGSYEIANVLQYHGVDYLAVAYADEGMELRKSGIMLPIMVMNPEPESFGFLIENDLQPEIFSFSILQQFENFLATEGIEKYPIHLKVDTGMHRLGFDPSELESLCTTLSRSGRMQVLSVFSHLVASEDEKEDSFTRQQFNIFTNACALLKINLGYDFIRHISNTAGIVRLPDLQLDMIRLGIGLYGIDTGNTSKIQLKHASRLKTTIAQIRKVKAGDSVGYNRRGIIEKDSMIATIRIGYADGFPRSLGLGNGKVLIKNQLAPVIGSVCMDMTMIDVTSIPGVKEGDEVEVFGKSLSVNQVAKWAGTIPYEIMTGISARVKRVYFED